MEEVCENCIFYQILYSNENFGKCKFPEEQNIETMERAIEQSLYGSLFPQTQFPIVHKEDKHDCFKAKPE